MTFVIAVHARCCIAEDFGEIPELDEITPVSSMRDERRVANTANAVLPRLKAVRRPSPRQVSAFLKYINSSKGITMLAFSKQEVPPALKSHLSAQFSFMSELSKKMFDGIQRVGQLNVQVAQTVMEEAINSAHQLIESNTPTEYMSIAAAQVQPVADKIRAYQQHLSNIGASVQAELSKTAEQHVPETSRTAAAVAEEIARRTTEESDKVTQRQKAAFEKLTRPINEATPPQNGSAYQQSPQGASAPKPPGKTV